jgi:hypothetical protein
MITMFRPSTITTVLAGAQSAPFLLLSAYFQPFLAPEPIYPLEVHQPAVFPQPDRNSAISIATVLLGEPQDILDYQAILLGLFTLIPLGAAGLAQSLAGLTPTSLEPTLPKAGSLLDFSRSKPIF